MISRCFVYVIESSNVSEFDCLTQSLAVDRSFLERKFCTVICTRGFLSDVEIVTRCPVLHMQILPACGPHTTKIPCTAFVALLSQTWITISTQLYSTAKCGTLAFCLCRSLAGHRSANARLADACYRARCHGGAVHAKHHQIPSAGIKKPLIKKLPTKLAASVPLSTKVRIYLEYALCSCIDLSEVLSCMPYVCMWLLVVSSSGIMSK